MPNITSLLLLALLVSVPALVLVVWVGLLFHRVLRLPNDQQKHGVTVLEQLTALARAGVEGRTANRRSARRRTRRTERPQNEGRS